MSRASLGNFQRLGTEIRVDPRLVVAGRLLRLGQGDLESAIENEIAENPAIERLEPIDPEPVVLQRQLPSADHFASLDESHDLADYTASQVDPRESVREQLQQRLPADLLNVGYFVVESLTDTGYLEEPVEEIALACRTAIEKVEFVIDELRKCEPAGVGAKNVVDCLKLQLRDDSSLEGRLARKIIENHLDLLRSRDVMGVARRYKVMPEVVEDAFALILELRPYPLDAPEHAGSIAPKIVPDIVVERDETGWRVEVPGPGRHDLRISPSFERLRSESASERRHIGHFVHRARSFIDGLEQRRRNLRIIGEALIRHQPGFLLTGEYLHLQPLTRAKLAEEIGIHESTVSRATADKFVQLACGEIVSFDVFFRPALRVQRMIEEILATEHPDRPMSDERIAQLLAERGVTVARRTVGKYRDRTKLPSSRTRRTA